MGRPPLPVDSSLTTFTLRANGTEVPGTFRIVSVVISRELCRIPHAHIVLLDGDAARQTFPISESAELAPGAEIEIDGGYSSRETRLFKGIVTRHRIEAGRGRDTYLHIEAKDPLYRAALARESLAFVDTSEGDFFQQILSSYISRIDVPQTNAVETVPLHQTSRWDFAVQRADALGMVCESDGDV